MYRVYGWTPACGSMGNPLCLDNPPVFFNTRLAAVAFVYDYVDLTARA